MEPTIVNPTPKKEENLTEKGVKIRQTKPPDFYRLYRKAHEDRYYLFKISALVFLTVVFSFLASYSLRQIISGSAFYPSWLSFIFWILALSLIPLILITSRGFWLIFSSFLITLAWLGAFLDFVNWPLIIVSLAGFLLLLVSSLTMKAEQNRLVKFNWQRILKAGLNYYLIVILTIVGLGSYNFLKSQSPIISAQSLISRSLLNTVSKLKINNLSLEMTVDDYLSQQIGNNLSGQSAKQVIALMRQDLSQKLNIKLTGKEKLVEVIELYLSQWFKGLTPIAQYVFYFLLILLALSVVAPLLWFLGKIILLVSFTILEILLALKFYRLETRSVEKEDLILNIGEQ